ncbi:OmpA family protein, partial [Cumulibacter manganitolerans]|uniref:OmpA family protein n=1 Tax=Cumulibacter manganitolerans TaxID=1884992 RepID=UPI001295E5EC
APAAATYLPAAGAPAQQPAPGPAPFPGSSAGNPLTIYFNYDSPALVDTTNEGVGSGQLAKLQLFAAHAQSARVTALTVNGYASPEGSAAHNATLAANRAGAVRDRLATLLSGVRITIGTTTELPGAQATWPSLRRADVFVTAPVI